MNTLKAATILVVDDDARNIKLLETLLQAEGYATLAASNGSEALEMVATKQPDLILLDVMMPDMDGFETVTRLKADPRTQQVPVIMVTALDDRASKLRALEAGAEEFLSKPIDRTDLTVRVRNLLRLKEYGDFLAQKDGHEVLQANDAEEGIRLAHEHLPSLILMDVQLPGMDGLTATRLLKADTATREIKIVALTAFAMNGDREKIDAAGCDAYIAKPIRYQEFLKIVSEFS